MKNNQVFLKSKIPTNLNILVRNERKKDIFGFITPNQRSWIKTITKLLLSTVLIVWAVYTLVFVLVNITNPYPQYITDLGSKIDATTKAALEELYHVSDQYSMWERYWYSIADLFSPSMGYSWSYGVPVSQLFWPAFLLSLQIGLLAIALSIAIGIPLGFMLARRKGKVAQFSGVFVAVIAFAIPSFVVALILATVSYYAGLPSIFTSGDVYSMFLVGLSLAIPVGLGYTRYLRNSVKQEYEQQYVKLARIKGASEKRVLWAHVSKPSLFPIINYFPMLVVGVIVGSIAVESVFGVPGSGTLLVDSAVQQDQSTLLVCTTFYTLLVVIAMFIRDIWIKSIDPRMKQA